ncbi:hypothetical protein ACI8B_260023 [Acinetobacter proteolyticus]|uniref:Uncharacterized protein n=1 Tax=Acinetobacter proteolyticus TaxID=1776741 RepID=A0A653K5X9_9GAMM|nr:hypothetical protein ACI8B_260023 [Acinetobacter proteolyticus]
MIILTYRSHDGCVTLTGATVKELCIVSAIHRSQFKDRNISVSNDSEFSLTTS